HHASRGATPLLLPNTPPVLCLRLQHRLHIRPTLRPIATRLGGNKIIIRKTPTTAHSPSPIRPIYQRATQIKNHCLWRLHKSFSYPQISKLPGLTSDASISYDL